MDAKLGFLVLLVLCLAAASAAQGPRGPDQTLGQTAVDLFDFATPGNEIDSQEDVALFLMFLGILFFPSRYVFRKAFEYIEESLSDSTYLSSDEENYSSAATFTALSVSIGGALLVGGTIGYGVGVFLVLAAVLSLVSLGLIGSVGLSLPSITAPSDPSGGDSVGSDPGAANEELSEAVETASGARQKLGDGNLEQALDLQQRCFEELEAEIKKMANKLSDVQSQLEEASNRLESVYQKEKEIRGSDFWSSLQNLEESIESGSNIGDIRSSLRDFIDGSDGPPNDAVGIKDVREEIKLLEELKGTVVHAENLISESRRIIEYSTQTLGEIAEEGSDDQEQRAESLLEKAQALNTELEDVESASETARGQLSDVATEESADAELLEENAERFVEAADSAEAIISSLEDLGLRTGAFLEASGSGFDVGEFLEQLQSLVPRLRENAEIRREEAKILEQNS